MSRHPMRGGKQPPNPPPPPKSQALPPTRAGGERWRAEALASLNDWHTLEASVPPWFTDGRLGQPWPKIVAQYIAHLEAELAWAKLNRR